MLKTNQERAGDFTSIPATIRVISHQAACELCGVLYKEVKVSDGALWIPAEHLHHIFGRRFLNQFHLNEHDRLNIISLCQRDHGLCKRAEERLFHGDAIGYLHELRAINFPLSYVWRAARQYYLNEILSLFATESTLR